jgi:tRNA dimethylallyltransferase
MDVSKPPVLCIVGPTATGKSALGIELAKHLSGEVLSADSMQVYRGMDIGTAKVTREEQQGVPHHLLDLVSPDVRFTVADWVQRADAAISEIHARGNLPIVVGGTGLYIRAITEDLSFAEEEGSEEVRRRWFSYLQQHGPEALHQALRERDPASAARLHPNDTRRVIRALEVFELGGKPLSAHYDWRVKGGRYWTEQFGLTADREVLYERVNARVDIMMEIGLLEEVAELRRLGYHRNLTSMQAIGYKELLTYLDGEVSLEQAVADIKMATRRFVKRQLSWFRRDPRVRWLHLDEKGRIRSDDLQDILTIGRQMLAGIRNASRE